MSTRYRDRVEGWLRGTQPEPSPAELAEYVVLRSREDYPGDPGRGVEPGEVPAHDYLRRVTLALSRGVLA